MKTKKADYFSAGLATVILALLLNYFSYTASATGNLQITENYNQYDKNIEVLLYSPIDQTVSGSLLRMNAEVKNNNDYPVVNGFIYIKIFRKQGKVFKDNDQNQIDEDNFYTTNDSLVDQFYTKDVISLKSKETKEISFEWRVPNYLPSGEYAFTASFIADKKFDTLGFTAVDDVIRDFTLINIKNAETEGFVEFQKEGVTVNDEPYAFSDFSKAYGEQELEIKAPLKNTTAQPQQVKVSWDTFNWDGLEEKNKIDSHVETINLQAGEEKILSYKIKSNKYPVGYLSVKCDWKDTHSILNILFGRQTEEKTKILFHNVSGFPLRKGQPVRVWAVASVIDYTWAFHRVASEEDADSKANEEQFSQDSVNSEFAGSLTLVLKDKNGQIMETFVHSGSIFKEPVEYWADYVPEQDMDYFTLESTLKDKEGNVIDKVITAYDCGHIDSDSCGTSVVKAEKQHFFWILIILLSVGGIIALVCALIKNKKTLGILIVVFQVLIFSGVFVASEAEAKTVCKTKYKNRQICSSRHYTRNRSHTIFVHYCRISRTPYQYCYNVPDPTPSNKPPTIGITCSPPLNVNIAGSFTVSGSDPEGGNIYFQADWNNDGNADENSPLVSSGGSHPFSHSWPTSGNKKVAFRSVDNQGSTSSWTTCTVEVREAPVNGACGSGLSFCSATTINSSTPGLCAAGTPSITHATKEWSWNCLGQNDGSDANNCSAGTLPNPGCATKQICSGSSFSSCDSSFCTGGATCALTGGTTWTCSNSCGSVSCNASILPKVDGKCGDWNGCANTGGSYCEEGTRIDFAEGPYESTWKCQGSCYGTTSSCSGRGPESCGWIETNP